MAGPPPVHTPLSTKTRTDRSPANRVATTTLDAQGRVVRAQVDSLEPVAFTYDPRGRLSTVTQGTGGTARTSTFSYNPEGFLETITDPLNRTVRFTYDPAGRVLTQILPDLRVIQTTYDANGNVASITPPSRPAHTFDYTPIDLEAIVHAAGSRDRQRRDDLRLQPGPTTHPGHAARRADVHPGLRARPAGG